jgi:hypothetical protein
VGFDEFFKQKEVALAFVLGEGDEMRERTGDRDDTEDLRTGSGLEFAFVA